MSGTISYTISVRAEGDAGDEDEVYLVLEVADDPLGFKQAEGTGRKLLKSIFQATADVIPDPDARRLTVRFHGLANPRATRALSELCALVNVDAPLYPGTDLRLHFEAPTLQE